MRNVRQMFIARTYVQVTVIFFYKRGYLRGHENCTFPLNVTSYEAQQNSEIRAQVESVGSSQMFFLRAEACWYDMATFTTAQGFFTVI